MWNPQEHPDEENLRWAWLRAMEWREWPLFMSQPIIPILLYFYPWTWVIGSIVLLTFLWWLIVVPRMIAPNLADQGPLFVQLKFITSPVMAYLLWRKGDLWLAILALLWPPLGVFIAKYVLMFLQVPFSFTASGKAAQIGIVQERLMNRLGYDRVQGVGYVNRIDG